jgi:hypothetical protein
MLFIRWFVEVDRLTGRFCIFISKKVGCCTGCLTILSFRVGFILLISGS